MPSLTYNINSKHVKDNLVNALDFIRCNQEFAQLTDERYPGIRPNQSGTLSSAYSRLKKAPADKYSSNIPQIEIPVSNKDLKSHNPTLLVGGEISCIDGMVEHSSFSLCVTFSSNASIPRNNSVLMNTDSCCLVHFGNAKRIVRRFHFDHQPNEGQGPATHLQYGGHFPSTDIDTSGWHYCLESCLDNPRLHYFPMDFVLVLDLAIRDFETPLRSLSTEPGWKKLVLKSQQIWWSSYLAWLDSTVIKRTDCILHEIIYS
jgi:hypothetical protein